MTPRRPFAFALLVVLACATHLAHAQPVRAWLDRDRISADQTTTLNIAAADLPRAPDYTPLERDFLLTGHASRASAQSVNGKLSMHTQYSVVLEPRHEGVIAIPSLRIGNRSSPPLVLTVTAGARAPSRAGDLAFIDATLDDPSPYVQQAVGLKLRLYYAVPLLSGQLDQPPPTGATLRKVGQDLQYVAEAGGRRYNVVERRFLLIGERSGRIVLPGARFRGQGVGGFFDDLFGDGRRALAADAPPRTIDVRPIPADAPQPWLPLNDLRLRYTTLPRSARAGEATSVTVEAIADGAVASQLPELTLDAGDAAQVFPEPMQSDETFDDGRPRTTLTRTFSIVPARAGALRVDAPRIDWWDVRGGVARTATLPPIALDVARGVGESAAPAVPAARASAATGPDDDGRIVIPGIQGRILPWAAATALFAVLWFITLMWGLHRRPMPRESSDDASAPAPPSRVDLRRALADGDLGAIADALCASVAPAAPDIDALRERLADPAQRDALDLLQRARWAGGDPRAARDAIRQAFAKGPRMHAPADATRSAPLPPLYPPA